MAQPHKTDTTSLPENAYGELAPGETYRPVMPDTPAPREVTPYSVTFGILMAVVFSAAAAYLGLRVGQVFEAAIPIAIIAVGVGNLTGRRNMLGQNVIIQSIGASSGVVVAGAIFTLPALYILGLEAQFYQIFLSSLFGGTFSRNDMVFAIGPAGSGKTYTAIALAVRALKNKEIKKIILSRPAVEAGEKLGFLPGDMKDKIDPYLQPLYDALQDMVPAAKLKEYMELNIIQIAPLAFMRGRTLNDAVVILDEAQNTTTQQIKMFLTRMGMNTKMIVTGDMTQIDLPQSQTSGLVQALRILKGVKGISFIELNKKDIVRHKLVTQIVEAYEKFDKEAKAEREKRKAEQAAGQQLPA